MSTLNFKVFEINDSQSILVFIFDSIDEAKRRYKKYGNNLTIKIANINDNEFAIEFHFKDIDLKLPSMADKALLDALKLSKLQPNVTNTWSCGYYSGVDIIPVYPLKPLTVSLW